MTGTVSIWDSVTSVEKLHLSVHPQLWCQICAISLFQLHLRNNNESRLFLPSGISVEDECKMLYCEAGCKSGYPDWLSSLIMKSKKEEFSFCQNLEMRFYVKIIHKTLLHKVKLFLVSIKSTIAKFC